MAVETLTWQVRAPRKPLQIGQNPPDGLNKTLSSSPIFWAMLRKVNWARECAVVIPCYNEGRAIGPVVRTVRQHLQQVFVVDDGSQDDTSDRAADAGATVLRLNNNLGKGAALQAGLRAAFDKGYAWALLMDGDGQHSPADIPELLQAAEQTDASLVIGDRMHDAARMPWLRRFVNRWMSRQLSRRMGRHLPDSQCGFRLVQLEAWASMALQARRFEIESEMLLKFLRASLHVEFVPVQVIYNGGQSKICPLRDTIRWMKWWWQTSAHEGEFAPRNKSTPADEECPPGAPWRSTPEPENLAPPI